MRHVYPELRNQRARRQIADWTRGYRKSGLTVSETRARMIQDLLQMQRNLSRFPTLYADVVGTENAGATDKYQRAIRQGEQAPESVEETIYILTDCRELDKSHDDPRRPRQRGLRKVNHWRVRQAHRLPYGPKRTW